MSSDSDGDVVWSRGDACLVLWSGDDSFYSAKILKFQNGTNSGGKKALIRFDGFGADEDELVDLNKLKKNTKKEKITKRSNEANDVLCLDSPPNNDKHVETTSTSMFKATTIEEERKRINDKYSLLEKEQKYKSKKIVTTPKTNMTPDMSAWNSTQRTPSDRTPGIRNRGQKKIAIQSKKGVVAVGGQVKQRRQSRVSQIKHIPPPKWCILAIVSRSISQTPENTEHDDDEISSPGIKGPRIPTGLTSSESEGEEDHKSFSSHQRTSPGSGFSDIDMEKPNFPNVVPRCEKLPHILSRPGEKPVKQIPATLNQYLRDYQREGIEFLYKHYVKGEGALLADDMGLGKTVQVIGFMSAVMGKTGTKIDVMKNVPKFIRKMSDNASAYNEESEEEKTPFLIIGPATVMHNWVDELETWAHFTVGKFHKNHKAQTVADLEKKKLEIVVTTYETCRDHLETLNKFKWEAIIADEAHKIKVRKAGLTKALKKLNCTKRFGLTGTPLQNKLQEFWCILDWANPKCLGELKSFETNVCKVIEKGQHREATKRELANARCAQEKLSKVKDKWMIRRTKKLIIDQLPKKEELVVYCKCTELQSDIYKTIMSQPDMKYVLEQKEPCTCGRDAAKGRCCYKETPDGRSIRSLAFTYMHLLMKAANHIALLLPVNIKAENQRKYAKQICESVFEKHPQFLKQSNEAAFRTLSDPKYCGKMKLLTGLLSVLRKKKSKVLLFSYSTRLLDIIEQYVMSRGYEYRRLDGHTPDGKRMGLIKEFNNDPSIFLFLVSTRAGGVGLNLTGANVVIIFDPNWNPSHDLQAQDRAYRLGQTRDVTIYRLICSGTIEENIYLRQILKQQQANIAVEGENAKRYFNEGEVLGIVNMFLLRESDRCLTEDILKRNRKVEEGLKTFRIENYIPDPAECKSDEDENPQESSDSEEDYSSTNSDNEKSDSSPLKRVSKNKGKPLRYETDSSENSDNYVNKIYGNNSSGTRTSKFGGDFHDSQQQSTSKLNVKNKNLITRQQLHRKSTRSDCYNDDNSDLEELWNDLDLVKDKRKGKVNSNVRNAGRRNADMIMGDLDNKKSNKGKATDSTQIKSTKGATRTQNNTSRGRNKIYTVDLDIDKADMSQNSQDTIDYVSSSDCESDSGYTSKHRNKAKNVGKIVDVKANNVKVTSSTVKHVRISKEASNKQKIGTDVAAETQDTYESISDVLDNCGVVHMHRNQKVIGPSRAEDYMTKCAIQDVYHNNQYSQAPAMECEPYSASSGDESDDLGEVHRQKRKLSRQNTISQLEKESVQLEEPPAKRGRNKSTKQQPTSWSQVIGNRTALVGQTPKGIRKQQFTALAAFMDVEPQVLAKQLLYSHPLQRLGILRDFYCSQDSELDPVMCSIEKRVEAQDKSTISLKKQGKKPRETSEAVKVKSRRKTKRKQPRKYEDHVSMVKSNRTPVRDNKKSLCYDDTESSADNGGQQQEVDSDCHINEDQSTGYVNYNGKPVESNANLNDRECHQAKHNEVVSIGNNNSRKGLNICKQTPSKTTKHNDDINRKQDEKIRSLSELLRQPTLDFEDYSSDSCNSEHITTVPQFESLTTGNGTDRTKLSSKSASKGKHVSLASTLESSHLKDGSGYKISEEIVNSEERNAGSMGQEFSSMGGGKDSERPTDRDKLLDDIFFS